MTSDDHINPQSREREEAAQKQRVTQRRRDRARLLSQHDAFA